VIPAPGTSRPSRDLALVATFAALVAALGLVPPLYPFGAAVPVTAQTLGVMLAGTVLGARRGALAVLTFLALVAAGLPLLAGGRGGLGVFAGPSAGYLLGWVAGAAVIGWLVARGGRLSTARVATANVLGGMLVVYLVAVPVLAAVTHTTLLAAILVNAVYLPGDLVKVAITTAVAMGVHRGYPLPSREHSPAPLTEGSL
jgi:biotin transport system substrate-specific component